MDSDAGVLAAAVLCWVACGYKFRHLRQRASDPGAPALRALVVVLGLLACVFTVLPTVVGRQVDALVGMPGVARLVGNVLAMVTCLGVLGWLLYLSRSRASARASLVTHARVLAVAVVLVLGLFAIDHPPVVPGREFDGLHMYVVVAYLAYAEVGLVALSWRYAAKIDIPLTRLGLRIVSVANVVGLLFLAAQLFYQLESDLGGEFPGSPAICRPLYTSAAILFVVGLTLPAWGPRVGLETLWWSVARWTARRQLAPLWIVMTAACPGVVLDRGLVAVSPHRRRLAAERLPVEIHDSWLHLRFYLTDADVAAVARLAEERGSDGAAIAAAYVLIAVRRKSAEGEAPDVVPPVEHLGAETGQTLVDDARFLCAVARAMHSSFARDALARATARVGAAHGA